MSKTHNVIYIPGLGDKNVRWQQAAVRTWKWHGVQPQIFQMNWADGEPFEPKFKRLLKLTDRLMGDGPVSVVGVSAGASAAIQLFAARKEVIKGVVCIAGKVNHPEAVSTYHQKANPAFWESIHMTPAALKKLNASNREHILSIRGQVDRLVPARDSTIDGAVNRQTWTRGHVMTIAVQLLFGSPQFLRFLKRL